VTNLFRITCAKFYKNWLSFVEDIATTILVCFLWDTVSLICRKLIMTEHDRKISQTVLSAKNDGTESAVTTEDNIYLFKYSLTYFETLSASSARGV